MAVFAWVDTLDSCRTMTHRLADRDAVVVTARTYSGRIVLVLGRNPANKAVAFVTLICCLGDRGVVCRLADCITTIMTSRTGTRSNPHVIP